MRKSYSIGKLESTNSISLRPVGHDAEYPTSTLQIPLPASTMRALSYNSLDSPLPVPRGTAVPQQRFGRDYDENNSTNIVKSQSAVDSESSPKPAGDIYAPVSPQYSPEYSSSKPSYFDPCSRQDGSVGDGYGPVRPSYSSDYSNVGSPVSWNHASAETHLNPVLAESVAPGGSSSYSTMSKGINYSKFKTKLCHYYGSNIKCPFGRRCTFSHGEQEALQEGSDYSVHNNVTVTPCESPINMGSPPDYYTASQSVKSGFLSSTPTTPSKNFASDGSNAEVYSPPTSQSLTRISSANFEQPTRFRHEPYSFVGIVYAY